MSYQSSYTGLQVDAATKYAVDPTIFTLKSNAATPMDQDIAEVGTYQDVVFTTVDPSVNGDFIYVGGVLTYTGADDMLLSLNISCSVETDIINTTVRIAQQQNDVVDEGAESSAKVESVTGIVSLNLATSFIVSTNDTLNLAITADALATIGIYHMQVVMAQKKIDC